MDEQVPLDLLGALADFELLVFGASPESGAPLAEKLLQADEHFTAYVVARLTREPIVLH